MLFTLPAFSISNIAARSDESIADFAKLTSLVLITFIIIWSVKRLRDAGKSSWWSLALIPPATIFLLIYGVLARSSENHPSSGLYIYGIRSKGFWKITSIATISLFLIYLSVLYITFLSDGF